jgi:hypothetical protein
MNYHAQLKKGMLFSFLSSLLLVSCGVDASSNKEVSSVTIDPVAPPPTPTVLLSSMTIGKKKIKIALLLDTSNSMDGLIDQAKAQLWKIVNELALAKCGDEKTALEIALYEYGNDNLSEEKGFIRQVSAFTGDLDLISEKLFGLRTNGGSEYCGFVISSAVQELNWQTNSDDLQLIFIAGNESFGQRPISLFGKNVHAALSTDAYLACHSAKEKGIVVNTIYCGNFDNGIADGWKLGADNTNGSYMSIEQDRKTVYIETPYDNKIAELNNKLNATYVTYGWEGESKKNNQAKQDMNASTYGLSNFASRAVSKSSKFYTATSWDLVDACKQKEFEIGKLKDSELPVELKGKTTEQKKEYIKIKTQERDVVIKEITALSLKRNAYIAEKSKETGTTDRSLDAAMIKAIKATAGKKNFVFEK